MKNAVELDLPIIHVLGSGPYAHEVAEQIPEICKVRFITDDANAVAKKMAIGIASPTVKQRVIEEFYEELEPEMFLSTLGMPVIFSTGYMHPFRTARGVNIGPLTTIASRIKIADFVSICSNVTIGHDVTIGKYSTICPGAVISGNVTICNGVFIGAGAVIKDGIYIGDGATIGCGAVVVDTVLNGLTVVGNPARPL